MNGNPKHDQLDDIPKTLDDAQRRTVRLVVDRPVMTVSECYQMGSQEEIPSIFERDLTGSREKLANHLKKKRIQCCTLASFRKLTLRLIPCIGWFQEYARTWREWLVPDIISGITAAIYQVPQGLGNGLMVNVPPVMGLYASFFPALVYSIMGTSRQTSMGTFTVLSLMMGSAVTQYAELNNTKEMSIDEQIKMPNSPLQLTIAASLISGTVQLVLGLLQLGALSILISPALANGFMAGCAFQIAISQLKGMFGLSYPDYPGTFNAMFTLKAFFLNLGNANKACSGLSVSVVVILIICKDYLNPHFLRICKAPLPADLIIVIVSTVISYCMNLPQYGVKTVNNLPLGLPSPVLPGFAQFKDIMVPSIAMGLVGYAITFSMGKSFAKKYNHKVDANQELLALGCGNILGGFFLCLPSCGSLARSSVLESVKCKTQLHAMLSCIILLFVFYLLGPLLEPLPNCVLAASIATAVKGYFFTLNQIWQLWAISRLDSIVWTVTCFSVLILDVGTGLVIGVIVALFCITWKIHLYKGRVLREISSLGVYLPETKKIKEITAQMPRRVTIYRFGTPLCFVTASNFENDILRIVNQCDRYKNFPNMEDFQKHFQTTIVVDCSSICFVDSNGVEAFKTVISKCRESDISLLLAAVPDTALKTLERSGTLLILGYTNLFPSIQDAVRFAQEAIAVEMSAL